MSYLFQKAVIFQFDSFWNTSHHFFQSTPIHFFRRLPCEIVRKYPFYEIGRTFCCSQKKKKKFVLCWGIPVGQTGCLLNFCTITSPSKWEKNKDSTCISWNMCKSIYLNWTPVQCWKESIKTSPSRKWESKNESWKRFKST